MGFRVLSPTAILGYGFPKDSFYEGLDRHPDVIAVDAGSTDPGPYYLGEGVSFTDRYAVKRDLEYIITEGVRRRIPIVIGTAGGCGSNIHLEWCIDIIREIANSKSLDINLGIIESEVQKDLIYEKLRKGEVHPLGPVPELTEDVIKATTRIVAQIGIEPFVKILDTGADVVIAGRSYDPAVFAAPAVRAGYDRALALHMGKILECAAIAASPGSGSDCMIGELFDDHFTVQALSELRECTITSVSAHTLYEKSDPYLLPGPGGTLDLRQTVFEEAAKGVIKVSGTRYNESDTLWVKLEGAKPAGFRTISIAGIRDPILIKLIEGVLRGVTERTVDNFSDIRRGTDYNIRFVTYGLNGVMGILEPVKDTMTHELGIIIEAAASTQELANTICGFARSTLLHYGYPGRKATAGNLALLYSPSDIKMGPIYEFSIHHLMKIKGYGEIVRYRFEKVRQS